LFDVLKSGTYWLGVQYNGNGTKCRDSDFVWTDCNTLDYKPFGQLPVQCCAGQCVYFDKNGWNFAPCNEQKKIICQQTKGKNPLTEVQT